MADLEQLSILKRSVRDWNEWRQLDIAIRPDLSGANLRGADLRNANLSDADLCGADLSGADLRGAHLNRTGLIGADLHGADLFAAGLRGAHLNRADLRGAHLTWANLSHADVSTANLTRAVFGETILGVTNLTGPTGLDSCVHLGPSILDHQTLARSGRLPLPFLCGCGLPDSLIEYLPSLLDQPLQFYSCFISYSHKEEALAQRVHADLQNNGVRCWYAPEDLKIGEKIRPGIDRAIHVHDKLLLILSRASISSQWVEQEVETALDKERKENRIVLFPIRADDAVMKANEGWPLLVRNSRNIGDFRNWKEHEPYSKAFERLLRDLRAVGGLPPARGSKAPLLSSKTSAAVGQ